MDQQGRMTSEQVRAHFASPEYRALSREGQAAEFARLRALHTAPPAASPPEPQLGDSPAAVIAYMRSLPPAEARAWRASNEAAFVNHNKASPGR